VNPDATEVCNGRDDDCAGTVDDGFDLDGDGVTTCADPPDCDDNDPGNFPGNDEQCDGVDNNCSGDAADESEDGDGDGFTPCDDPGDCDDTGLATMLVT
jgi:hypothetical protein